MRTSASQFELMVSFMESHGDLSRPSDGPHGKITNMQKWKEMVDLLNSDAVGETKTEEKWRKTWSDLKNNTKRKVAKLNKAVSGTGGGPASRIRLSDIEERVLAIMNPQAATGMPGIAEVGLQQQQKGAKSLPLTKEEVMMLVDLIHAHPVLFSKATNATNNQLKEATWVKLTARFNSMISSNPRKPDQLRLKWENLKKAARKRSTKIRMNNLKTGGGKSDFIPPDEALDKVASILGSTCDGYSVPFGGDAEIEVAVDSTAEESVEEQVIVIPFDDSVAPLSPAPAPAQPAFSPLHTPPPPPKKHFFSSAHSKGKLKRQAAADEAKASVIARNRAIAEYYEEKKKQEALIATLKKRKLELEIIALEKINCPDPCNNNRQ